MHHYDFHVVALFYHGQASLRRFGLLLKGILRLLFHLWKDLNGLIKLIMASMLSLFDVLPSPVELATIIAYKIYQQHSPLFLVM